MATRGVMALFRQEGTTRCKCSGSEPGHLAIRSPVPESSNGNPRLASKSRSRGPPRERYRLGRRLPCPLWGHTFWKVAEFSNRASKGLF